MVPKQDTAENKSIYERLGRIVSDFESLVLQLKMCIYTLLILNGLKDLAHARILLSDQTAYPILQKLRSMVAHHYTDRKTEARHIGKLFSQTASLIEHRNFMLHGSWFFDRQQANPTAAEVLKDKIFKDGVDAESRDLSAVDMDLMIEKIKLAEQLFTALNLCIYEPDRDLTLKIPLQKINALKIP